MIKTRGLLIVWTLMFVVATSCSSDNEKITEDETGKPTTAASSQAVNTSSDTEITQSFSKDIELTSTVFNRIRRMPVEYTCTDNEYYPTTGTGIRRGEDKSPDLAWSSVPEGTVSFAIIVDDPDVSIDQPEDSEEKNAPAYVHWLIWNIPGDTTGLAEKISTTTEVSTIGANTRQGTNDYGKIGYSGPCPPPNLTAIFGSRSGDQYGEGGGLRKQTPHGYMFKIYALDTELDLAAGATKAELVSAIDGHILSGGELKGEYVNKRIFK